MQCYETDNMPCNETDSMQCYETDTTTRQTNTILGTHTGLSSSWIHTKTHNTTLGTHTGFSPLWILTKIHDTLLGTHTGFSSLWILTKLHNMIFGTHAGISPHGLTPKLITLYSKSSDDTTLDRIILLWHRIHSESKFIAYPWGNDQPFSRIPMRQRLKQS